MTLLSSEEIEEIKYNISKDEFYYDNFDTINKLLSHIDALTAANQELRQANSDANAIIGDQANELRKIITKLTAQIEDARKVLTELRDACKQEPAMNKREYIQLGIAVNNILATLERKES